MSVEVLRAALVDCLGGPWLEPCPLRPALRDSIHKDGYRIESLTYEVEPGDRVPALLLIPEGVSERSPAAAISERNNWLAPRTPT